MARNPATAAFVKLLLRCALALMCFTPVAALGAGSCQPCRRARSSRRASSPNRTASPASCSLRTATSVKATSQTASTWTTARLIPGAGWVSVGPGYRHWYGKDMRSSSMRSASISVNNYRLAQARAELPEFLKSRLALGAQARWQDFGRVDYFGVGPTLRRTSDRSTASNPRSSPRYATLRPFRWMDIGAPDRLDESGRPRYVEGPFRPRLTTAARSCRPKSRDDRHARFPRPSDQRRRSCAALARATTIARVGAQHASQRYEGEAAGFLPIGGGRVVLALHGWTVRSDTRDGAIGAVLPPAQSRRPEHVAIVHRLSLPRRQHARCQRGGPRLALMTHLDLAVFADAGNVAALRGDLDLVEAIVWRRFPAAHTPRDVRDG